METRHGDSHPIIAALRGTEAGVPGKLGPQNETLFPKIRTEKGHGRILLQVKNGGLERSRDLDFSAVRLSVVSKPEVGKVNREFKQTHSRFCCVSLFLALFFSLLLLIFVYGCCAYTYVSPPHECLMPE